MGEGRVWGGDSSPPSPREGSRLGARGTMERVTSPGKSSLPVPTGRWVPWLCLLSPASTVLDSWSPGDRITESLRLEETSKVIKSNHQPNTTMPAKPCPKVLRPHVF